MEYDEIIDIDNMILKITHRTKVCVSEQEERGCFEEIRRILMQGSENDDSGICQTIG